MAYPEVIIPPWVRPESPVEITLIDDQTTIFSPRFGRGTTQRQKWGDPVWGLRLRYRGLSQSETAAMTRAVDAARGRGSNIRLTPGIPIRGSFPATELLANNDFSSTSGWSGTSVSQAVSDGVMRATRTATGGANVLYNSSAVTGVQYAPYVARAFFSRSVSASQLGIGVGSSTTGVEYGYTATHSQGLVTKATVPFGTSLYATVFDNETTGSGATAGVHYEIAYISLSRCIQADNGPNALTYSDQIDNAAWTKAGASVAANALAAADGTTTADYIVEDSSTGNHFVYQSGTRASVAEDLFVCGVFQRGTGNNRDIRLGVGSSGSNFSHCIFDLSAGTAGSVTNVGTNTNGRAFIVSKGNGLYFCCVVARAAASTSIYSEVVMVSGSSSSYAGNGTSSVAAWRVCSGRSSVPSRGAQTTTTATTGTSQTGTGIYVKGLPVSTLGLLRARDFVEINGELVRCTADLDSDAAGLGYLQIAPGLSKATSDNDPVIVNNPMGTFMFASDPRIVEQYGVYADVELDLVSVYPGA